VDLRGVDVDVHDARARRKRLELAGDAVVEPHAEGHQQVGLVDGIVGVDGAVHAEHLQRVGVVAGERAEAHQRRRDGRAGAAREFAELGRRVERAAADV
jgi:hypothetical protein